MISRRLNEALANRYGGTEGAARIKRAFDITQISEAMQVTAGRAFAADCCVVFSDISGFSGRTRGRTPEEIKSFLDDYYAYAIPIIYTHGGLIDQMFGDGIISVFCRQLSEDVGPEVFRSGLRAAEKIVETFAGNANYTTKCALHKGTAVICEIGDNNYRQASLVGEVMTVVHRVESVAKDESVNMLLSLPEAAEEYERVRGSQPTGRAKWTLAIFGAHLKGVSEREEAILYEKFNQ